ADRRRVGGRVGMLGEPAEVDRGLAPQLAAKATLAERERDRQRAAIEVVRFVEELVRGVLVAERGGDERVAMDERRELRARRRVGRALERRAQVIGGGGTPAICLE